MANTKIFFNSNVNSSAQIGDIIHVADVGTGGVLAPPEFAGEIIGIGNGFVTIDKDPSSPPIIDNTKFILFAKKAEVNESSLKGYYADVTFENHSNTYVELFAISSDIALSSK